MDPQQQWIHTVDCPGLHVWTHVSPRIKFESAIARLGPWESPMKVTEQNLLKRDELDGVAAISTLKDVEKAGIQHYYYPAKDQPA